MAEMAAIAWMRRNWWQVVVLTIAGWTGFYCALILPLEFARTREFAAQRSSGLGAVAEWDPVSLWRQASWRDVLFPAHAIAAQRGRSRLPYAMGLAMSSLPSDGGNEPEVRFMVRTASFDLEVKSPGQCAEHIRSLAEKMGGYLVSSEIGDDRYAVGGMVTVRIPAARYQQMRDELRRLAVRVESEKADANDVTRDYVDKEARLRNLRAQENQYLAILKHAATVKDTLDVSDKISAVRGQIEAQQAEFATLQKQVETVAIAISLRAEADAQVFGIHWRPIYELKLAARDGLDSLASYVAVMTAALFRLPAFLLWVSTLLTTIWIGWRSSRWLRKKFFAPSART
jgi:uncharacterized protein DUF4349